MFVMSQRQYSKEFKMQIANLILKDGIAVPILAEKFNIHPVLVYRWVQHYKEYGDDAFVGTGHQHTADKELKKLLNENKRLKMENEILKKAAAYFAKHPAGN